MMRWNRAGWKKKIRAVLHPDKGSFFLRYRTLLLLAVPLLTGLLTGVIFCRKWNPGTESGIARLVQAFLERRQEPEFWKEFAYSFESVFFFFLILFLCGLSLMGAVLVPAVLLVRGVGLGAVMGSLYAGYGTSGILYSVFAMMPFACGTSILLLLLGREGIRFSERLFQLLCGAENGSVKRQFGRYCVRSGVIVMLLCVAAMADSAWNLLMSGIL